MACGLPGCATRLIQPWVSNSRSKIFVETVAMRLMYRIVTSAFKAKAADVSCHLLDFSSDSRENDSAEVGAAATAAETNPTFGDF